MSWETRLIALINGAIFGIVVFLIIACYKKAKQFLHNKAKEKRGGEPSPRSTLKRIWHGHDYYD